VHPVRDGGDQAAQEVPRGAARHLLVHLDEGELRRSVDGDDEEEFALRGSDFGDVDMKIAMLIRLLDMVARISIDDFSWPHRMGTVAFVTSATCGVIKYGLAGSGLYGPWPVSSPFYATKFLNRQTKRNGGSLT
jgi:hypothetical protein